MLINLNTQVKVTLNDKAVNCIRKQEDELQIPAKYRKEVKAGDVWTGPLWELSQLFGSALGNGMALPFDSTDVDFTEIPGPVVPEPSVDYLWTEEHDALYSYTLDGRTHAWDRIGDVPEWVDEPSAYDGVRLLAKYWVQDKIKEVTVQVRPQDGEAREYKIQQVEPSLFTIAGSDMPKSAPMDILALREFMRNPMAPPRPVIEQPKVDPPVEVGVDLV